MSNKDSEGKIFTFEKPAFYYLRRKVEFLSDFKGVVFITKVAIH